MKKTFEVKTKIYKNGKLVVKGSSFFEDSTSLIEGLGKSFIYLAPKVIELHSNELIKKQNNMNEALLTVRSKKKNK